MKANPVLSFVLHECRAWTVNTGFLEVSLWEMIPDTSFASKWSLCVMSCNNKYNLEHKLSPRSILWQFFQQPHTIVTEPRLSLAFAFSLLELGCCLPVCWVYLHRLPSSLSQLSGLLCKHPLANIRNNNSPGFCWMVVLSLLAVPTVDPAVHFC